MFATLRIILITMVCLGLAASVGYAAFSAIMTGRVRVNGTSKFAHYRREPLQYCTIVAILVVFATCSVAAWWFAIYEYLNAPG